MKNFVFLIGRLGKDPGTYSNVTSLNIATSDKWKNDAGEWQEKTEWHSVVCFKINADKAAKYQKGDLLTIEGKLQTRSYEKDGETKYKTEIIAHRISRIIQANKPASTENGTIENDGFKPQKSDDLPF